MSDSIVLCYHAVSERWPAPLAVTPEQLESQLRSLLKRGYRGSTFHEAVTGQAHPRSLAVTFDDAYRSVLELAHPVLERFGLVATVFVPTAFPGRPDPMSWAGIDGWMGGPYEHELVCMSWDEVSGLAAAGWEIGSHTSSHPRLSELDDEHLKQELTGSKATIEDALGLPCRSLAYPYGDHDRRVIAQTEQAGYEAAGTLPAQLHPAEPLRWPRIGVYRRDRRLRFALKSSRAIRRIRSASGH